MSAGFVDKANARLAAQLNGAGFAEAMQAALLTEPVLTALGSRRHDEVIASLQTFTGYLIVDGYWQNGQTLARWCLINSYLTTARNHGLTILDAITRALNGGPWLPQHALA